MNTEDLVRLIFSKMLCSCCNEQFTPESVEIIRIEENCAIVNIICTHCNKDYGIVIVGIEQINQDTPSEKEEAQIPDLPPINSKDVIAAHKFFSNLDADWEKYIPDKFKKKD